MALVFRTPDYRRVMFRPFTVRLLFILGCIYLWPLVLAYKLIEAIKDDPS